ncbi:hypothetical protein EMPS_09041 [Entomortierella parvispora]|uniref:Uncharacterized protein n=1 Tax=Entomortierella parvispora TaxID=205924 RepID=A0A9P3HI01_9FUNG|nr:hypothetical protein EMPS_09041 [Entomortierella parvispora]
METIYGIQADTETLREAHEYQKRMQSRLQEQQSTSGPTKASATKAVQSKSGLSMLKPSSSSSSTSLSATSSTAAPSASKPSFMGRSTSTSALPSNSNSPRHQQHPQPLLHYSGQNSGQTSPTKLSANSSTANSPFFTAVDYHHQLAHQHAPGQLLSTTQSPAFLAKFYEGGNGEIGVSSPARLPGSMGPVPWLSLPGAVTGANPGGVEHSSSGSSGGGGLFARRRSDAGLGGGSGNATGRSTPLHSTGLVESALPPSLDALHLYQHSDTSAPHPHHHPHPQLLSHQDLAVLSRNNSPMPSLNEALPRYLRKKSVDSSLTPMERSFSSPGHHGPVSPFMLPMPSTAGNTSTASSGGTGGGHSLFTFPSKTSTPSHTATASPVPAFARPEMERASSTGVLPMNRPGLKDPSTSHYQHQQQPHSHLGLNSAASASVGNLSTTATGTFAPTTASIFRTGTPLTSIPSNLGAGHGTSASSRLHHPFGSATDRDLPSKEVHA